MRLRRKKEGCGSDIYSLLDTAMSVGDIGVMRAALDFCKRHIGDLPEDLPTKEELLERERLHEEIEKHFTELWGLGTYNDVMWLIDGVMGFSGESPGLRDLDLKTLRGLAHVARREARLFQAACVLCDASSIEGGIEAGPGYFGMVCRDCWRKLAEEWRDHGASWQPLKTTIFDGDLSQF